MQQLHPVFNVVSLLPAPKDPTPNHCRRSREMGGRTSIEQQMALKSTTIPCQMEGVWFGAQLEGNRRRHVHPRVSGRFSLQQPRRPQTNPAPKF